MDDPRIRSWRADPYWAGFFENGIKAADLVQMCEG
jgi:hypothetical protein